MKKPTARDIRPIALTDSDYKIMMDIIKEAIEDHLEKNELMNECQSGFTKGRRIEDNIFILESCIEETRKRKEGLAVLAIDFKKAYDSVDRKKMMETLKYFKIDERVINFIYKIYQKDPRLS